MVAAEAVGHDDAGPPALAGERVALAGQVPGGAGLPMAREGDVGDHRQTGCSSASPRRTLAAAASAVRTRPASFGAIPAGGALTARRDLARPDVVLVRVPLDLHRVPGPIGVGRRSGSLVAADRLLHLRDGGEGVVAAGVAGDQLRLQLDEGKERRDRLGEPDRRPGRRCPARRSACRAAGGCPGRRGSSGSKKGKVIL